MRERFAGFEGAGGAGGFGFSREGERVSWTASWEGIGEDTHICRSILAGDGGVEVRGGCLLDGLALGVVGRKKFKVSSDKDKGTNPICWLTDGKEVEAEGIL